MWHLTSSETVESTTYLALHFSWYSPTYCRHKPHHLLLFSTCSRTPQDVFCKAAFNLLILTLQLLAVTAWLRCPTLHLPLLTQKVSAAHFLQSLWLAELLSSVPTALLSLWSWRWQAALQCHHPALSGLPDASHLIPWTCARPVFLRALNFLLLWTVLKSQSLPLRPGTSEDWV